MVMENQPKQIILKPYTGPGYGVLVHGTVLKEPYKGSSSIAGHLDLPGTWIMDGK